MLGATVVYPDGTFTLRELGSLTAGDVLEMTNGFGPDGTRFMVLGASDVYACEVAIRRLADGEVFHYPLSWRVFKAEVA